MAQSFSQDSGQPNVHTIGLTFDDVLLLPNYSEVLPKDVALTSQLTKRISLGMPLLSAAMDTVTEANMAIRMAEQGGLGVLHHNMNAAEQARQVRVVKSFESGIVSDPITVSQDTNLQELRALVERRSISGVPVVNGKKLVGMVTRRDYCFASDPNALVTHIMTPKEKLITVPEGATREQAMQLFAQHRIEKLPIVNADFELCGLITVKDILKAETNPNACKDERGRLRVAAAVSTGEHEQARIKALVEVEVDLLVVDTAHGHSKGVIAQVAWIKQQFPDVCVMAGNIATGEAAAALIEAGADALKVGMGPGSICTTRIVAGIGVPQITAIQNVSAVARRHGIPVVADGGIRFSGDICKAIAAGASAVMIGSLLAGTEESPGEVMLYQGRSYKVYYGMGSVHAMSRRHGSHDRYFQQKQDEQGKYVPEGIEGRVPFKGALKQVVYQLCGGLRSCMGYTGCAAIKDMHKKTCFIRITNAGMRESHVHDVIVTKEAPNYSVEND